MAQSAPLQPKADEALREDIRRWLNLRPGELLMVRRPRMGKLMYIIAAGFGVAGAWAGTNRIIPVSVVMWFGFALWLHLGWSMNRDARLNDVVLDDEGIETRWKTGERRRLKPWSEVWRIDQQHFGRFAYPAITTSQGQLWLDPKHPATSRIVQTVENVLAARAAGRQPPSDEPVSSSALSRLTGEAAPADSSLSRGTRVD